MKLPKLKNIKGMDKDDLLAALGLRTKDSFAEQLLGTLGTFGIGLLVGAGVALLLAPKPGRELREQLRAKLRRAERDLAQLGQEDDDDDDDAVGVPETTARRV